MRLIRLLDNGRFVTRGVSAIPGGAFIASQFRGEAETYRIDLSLWLASGETISALLLTSQNLDADDTIASEHVDLEIEQTGSYGSVEALITTSAGRKHQVNIAVREPEPVRRDVYRDC